MQMLTELPSLINSNKANFYNGGKLAIFFKMNVRKTALLLFLFIFLACKGDNDQQATTSPSENTSNLIESSSIQDEVVNDIYLEGVVTDNFLPQNTSPLNDDEIFESIDNSQENEMNSQEIVNNQNTETSTNSSEEIHSVNNIVTFSTHFKQGSDALIEIQTQKDINFFLNAWFDWNNNGIYENNNEYVLVNEQLIYEKDKPFHKLKIRVPEKSSTGQIWTKFQLSELQNNSTIDKNTPPITDIEEEHNVTIEAQNLIHNVYPSENKWVTLAFEDSWPFIGDFDFNDVALLYRVDKITNNQGDIVRYDIYGSLKAYGANLANGFAVKLDGIPSEKVDGLLTKLVVNNTTLHNVQTLEQGTIDAVIIISNNLKDEIEQPTCTGELGAFYRVWKGCFDDAPNQYIFIASIPFITPIPPSDVPKMPLNPFIFGTPDINHGSNIRGINGREIEIHLKNHDVSSKANISYFSTQDDTSIFIKNRCPGIGCDTYHNSSGLPWAILVESIWNHPSEGSNILQAYPELTNFAISGGGENTDWYIRSNANLEKIYE
ncbi:hypothetical protein C9J41_15935 [Photobacterium sp. GB-50]|nr:hypothetical protein C9J46_17790 [Photobacterium sp. GB-36]PSW72590.1 hypothetical protein C9J41_15935 [Photobacterium sp. GB-50]